jgi:hypothetical protein
MSKKMQLFRTAAVKTSNPARRKLNIFSALMVVVMKKKKKKKA